MHGARQTGKTTLVQKIAEDQHPARYLTFDDIAVLSAAKNDPSGFIAGFDGPVVLDEVQRVPELFVAIKAAVEVIGVEVKASATVGKDDFRGLKALAETAGKNFLRGVVLYTGTEVIPFAENVHAAPLALLWQRRG